MKRKITVPILLSLAMFLVISLFPSLYVNATENTPAPTIPPSPPPEWHQQINRQVDDLRLMVEDLQNQQNNRPPESPPTPQGAPNPMLLSPQNITLAPGETQDVTITIRNIGALTAHNLLTQAVADGPFTIQFLNNSNSVNTVSSNRDAAMTMRITADDNAQPGTHAINITNSFRNQNRENLTPTTGVISVRITGVTRAPNMRLGNFRRSTNAAVVPGQNFTISADLQNIGAASAHDVQVSFPDLDASMVFFTGDPNQAFFSEIDSDDSHTVNFNFQVAARLDYGMHTVVIPFQVTYRDENGENREEREFNFPVNIYNAEDDSQANLQIRNMTSPTGRIGVDEIATVTFDLYNAGEAEARNIRLEATPENTAAVVPMGTSRIQSIPLLAPGQSQQMTFSFSPRAAANTQSYAIGFDVSYELGQGADAEPRSLEQFAFASINVYNPDDEDDDEDERIQIPRIIVSHYTVYPRVPWAGQTFEMEITFQNTNATRSVNNIVITLEALEAVRDQGTVFSPAEGSNTMFIEYIPPRGEVTRTISWFTVSDASPRSYPMRISFVYQDQDFREFSAEENLNINVQQVVDLDLSDMHIPSSVMQGGSIWLDMQIINSGMVTLRNLRVRVEGPFDTREADMFIGNINPGSFRSYTGSIVPLESGFIQGTFIVYGEDATGATVEFPTPFNVEVEGGDMGFGGEFGDREFGFGDGGFGEGDMMFEGGGIIWGPDGEMIVMGDNHGDGFNLIEFIRRPVVWGTGIAIAVAAIIIMVIVIRKNSKKLDFDDDND